MVKALEEKMRVGRQIEELKMRVEKTLAKADHDDDSVDSFMRGIGSSDEERTEIRRRFDNDGSFDFLKLEEHTKSQVKVLLVDFEQLGMNKSEVLRSLKAWFEDMRHGGREMETLIEDSEEAEREDAELIGGGEQSIQRLCDS